MRREDRGIALVETAIVAPLLILLFLGMIEAGFAYRDSNTLSRATQQSARSAARLADNPLADYEALRSLESGLAAVSSSSLVKVIVYDAGSTGATPPASCLNMPRPDNTAVVGNDSCNVYSPTQVSADQPSSFGCGAGAWDANFCPTQVNDRSRTGENPTKLGVWVELSYDKVTKVLPGSIDLTRGSVYQLEPCIAGDPTC